MVPFFSSFTRNAAQKPCLPSKTSVQGAKGGRCTANSIGLPVVYCPPAPRHRRRRHRTSSSASLSPILFFMFVTLGQGSGDTVHDILDPDPKLHALMPFAQYAKLQLLSPNSPSPSKVSFSLPFAFRPPVRLTFCIRTLTISQALAKAASSQRPRSAAGKGKS